MRLSDKFGVKNVQSPLKKEVGFKDSSSFLDDSSYALEPMSSSERVDSSAQGQAYYQLLRAGPRELLHFDPAEAGSCAAIVTCGAISPGLNMAIREIAISLRRYGVARIFGIMDGLNGVMKPANWLELTEQVVQNIHKHGGTILKNQRDNPRPSDTAAVLKAQNVRHFFALGGDGAHRGVLQILTALDAEEHDCACVALPISINNDLPMVERTLGFGTACTEARNSVDSAYVEATCNANCIGLVKLPGQSSGFLAVEATLAARHVDICLVPEMEISLYKVLDHCETLMSTKGYAVVIVTEGCKDSLARTSGVDLKDVDVGLWLKDEILARFKQKGKTLTIKYIDPSHAVGTVEANANDNVLCATSAEHAVHGAMAGITGFTVSKVYERNVYVPLQVISKSPQKALNPTGRWFARMIFTTHQPPFEPNGFQYEKSKDTGALRALSTPIPFAEALRAGTEILRLGCANLSSKFTSKSVESPLASTALCSGGKAFVKSGEFSCQTLQRSNASDTKSRKYFQLQRCGPQRILHFDPSEPGAAAAIVTCGGLCPGLNSVVRELAKMLHAYGVKTVWGIRGGFKGCTKEDSWIELRPDVVQDIHMKGGSILVSDRGNPPHSEIAKVLQRRNIRQYFVLGGDGTHKGAMQSFVAMTEIGHECAVVGVPKTIDNDIQLIDRSFGFDTACTEAERAISAAYVEATTNANCIGLVKLMGRHCGWIAATATLAARNVDICLIPEMDTSLDKLLDYVAELMRKQKRAVIVVAEGCGDTIIKGTGERDAGGNKVMADVGPYLKDQITSHCKKNNLPVTIKYIDPTYMIRSVAANAYDQTYCAGLAQEAVHAAMAGYTGISVGRVDGRYVMLPIYSITEKGPRKVELKSRFMERLMFTTKQPNMEP